jgi:D-alanyl-D-alanine carboxypeptidase
MGIGRLRCARIGGTALAATLLLAGCVPSSGVPSGSPSPTESRPAVDQPTTITTPAPTPTATPTPAPEPAFDKKRLSIDDPASLWVIVNKLRPLNPADYEAPDLVDVPVQQVNGSQLRSEASGAAAAMFEAAADEGLELASQSAYRSYPTQVRVYNGWVNELGREAADLTSARPGHSEHQTGLSIDISAVPANCSLDQCFGDTPQGRWLAQNAWTFGFVLRYPEGTTPITGYEYEPWHFRYVGEDLAAELHDEGDPTLEEFFGLPAAPDYAD